MLSAQGPFCGAALAFSGGSNERTRVNVDGFNLYYGALKGTPFKWLDPVRLATHLLPCEYAIDRLRYFAARVSGKLDPRAPRRQQNYLKALSTLPEVDVHYGRFLAKTAWRPLANLLIAERRIETPRPVTLPRGNFRVLGGRSWTLPVGIYRNRRGGGDGAPRGAGRPIPDAVIAEFHTMEEKGSDVNLAAHLLNDAWQDLFEAAAVISNDTDLVVPIRMVTEERKRPVFVVCPGRWPITPQLRQAASYVRHIRPAILRAAQFPDTVPGTGISKPADW